MRGELVAIDLETTGLDPAQDEIIEIGAVRIVDGVITDSFSTLVHPGKPIPSVVTVLTGIQNDDLIGAPTFKAIASQLQAFVGDAPLLGHSVTFDTSFLNKQKLFLNNTRVDTYELASVLLPGTPRYALSSLTTLFGFDIESAHRALYDAKATAFIFEKLWELALQLPILILEEIVRLSEGLTWDASTVFTAALNERVAHDGRGTGTVSFPALQAQQNTSASLTKSHPPQPLTEETIDAIFAPQSPLAGHLENYERRPQQVEMAVAIGAAFSNSQHLIIEAATGIGKSIGYLVPSALWSLASGERVVISTNTINLQDQLITKDVPTLREAVEADISVALLKGRINYICPRQLELVRRRKPANVDELRTIAKVLVWLLTSQTGDRNELSLRGPEEQQAWQQLSADHDRCSTAQCQTYANGTCPFYRARTQAEHANLVIVNHALLVADSATDQPVIPEYQYLVVDEAHHLEEATTSSLTHQIDALRLYRRLADLGDSNRGILGSLLTSLRTATSPSTFERYSAFVGDIGSAIRAARAHVRRLFDMIRALLQEIDLPQETYSSVRITQTMRSRPDFASIQITWQELGEFYDGITSAIQHLIEGTTRIERLRESDLDSAIASLRAAVHDISATKSHLQAFIQTPQKNDVYWFQLGQNFDYVSLNIAPLHVGALVNETLWHHKRSVILTSATLRAHNDFKYIVDRLHAENIKTLELATPFDYQTSTLLFIPDDLPDPNDRQRYQQAVERILIDLTSALNGRVLALFTSYAHLKQTAYAIGPRLALGDITVYDQSDGSSRQALLDGFKTAKRAILMGTRSFWEGIDIPGDQLSALVIVKLPFSVPTDPVFSSRSETYNNAFNDYTMPDAILKFRQGFGRLIRSRTDRGIVTILDARIRTKSYGSNFIDALPDCTVQTAPSSVLPEAALKWLGKPKE